MCWIYFVKSMPGISVHRRNNFGLLSTYCTSAGSSTATLTRTNHQLDLHTKGPPHPGGYVNIHPNNHSDKTTPYQDPTHTRSNHTLNFSPIFSHPSTPNHCQMPTNHCTTFLTASQLAKDTYHPTRFRIHLVTQIIFGASIVKDRPNPATINYTTCEQVIACSWNETHAFHTSNHAIQECQIHTATYSFPSAATRSSQTTLEPPPSLIPF